MIETLLENNGYFHVKDFAARFRTYYDQGIKDIVKPPIGINATTKAVLENSTFQTNPVKYMFLFLYSAFTYY